MAFHIVLPRSMSDEELSAVKTGGDRPRNGFAMLAQTLSAKLHSPTDDAVSMGDLLRSKIAGPRNLWNLARRIALDAKPGDVFFCGSEAGGLQLSEALNGRTNKICMFVHNLNRPRGRLALRLFNVKRNTDLVLACSQRQSKFLATFLSADWSRVKFIWDHTDTAFFSPGPPAPGKRRPLIVSVGLEQRDYQTLAAATSDINADVRISGFSEDAAVLARTFPPTLPANMSRKFYEWRDLVQLYRDADVVVVSVHQNEYAAGVQSLMEGMACARPIVATTTAGLEGYLDKDVVTLVPPGDVPAMRAAIELNLKQRPAAEERGVRGLDLARSRHGIDRYVSEVAGLLRDLDRVS
jgi:glycosyltransferase involved in cell wall biosynthesis